MEDRLKALVLISPGFYLQKRLPEVDQLNFAPRVKAPVLMLNGRFDFIFPTGSSQEPMFRLLGTPQEHKRRVLYDTGHDIPRNEMIKESLRLVRPLFGASEIEMVGNPFLYGGPNEVERCHASIDRTDRASPRSGAGRDR